VEFIRAWVANPSDASYAQEASNFVDKYVYREINVPTVGASGAIYGILLAFGMIFPNMPLVLIFFPFFPIRAKYMVIAMGVIELVAGFTMSDNVAHFAHLGGMVFGFFLIKYWNTSRQDFY
jgi:membrane associated rhomboid family serine protease